MIRHKLKYSILAVIVFCLAGLSFISWYYDKSPLFVSKIAARAFALNAIALFVTLHDPSPVVLQNSAVPVTYESESLNGTLENLTEATRQILPNHKITIVSFDNTSPIRSKYSFAYQSAADTKIISLREKYELSKLLFPTVNDFEQIVAIANWVHSQWIHGASGAKEFNPGEFNADKILTRARQGDRFWCHVYSMTFIQVAASLGYQARLVSLTNDGYESSDMHAVAEVWSNFYGKWIAVDTDFNIWYTRNGTPLNVLEIHNAVLSNSTDTIRIVKGIQRPQPDFESRIPSIYKYYRYFYVDMRNDWLSNIYFPGHPKRSDKASLFWVDNRLPPVLTLMTKVNNPNDLYWDLNNTYLTFGQPTKSSNVLPVSLHTLTPNYTHIEVTDDNSTSKAEKSGKYDWTLHKGINSLKVRSINSTGHTGKPASIVLEVSDH